MRFTQTHLWITLVLLLTGAFFAPRLPFAKQSMGDPISDVIMGKDPQKSQSADLVLPNLPTPAPTQHPTQSIKDFKITTTKKGYLNLPWEVLATHDVEKKEIKPNRQLKKFVDKKVLVSGFPIPLDFNNKNVKEFLLVPYFPNCMHVPPPPVNQILHVKFSKGQNLPQILTPLEVEGKLTISKKAIKNSGAFYLLKATGLKQIKQ